MKSSIASLIFLFIGLTLFAQVPDKAAPFTAVKWSDEQPVVRVEGGWYELQSLNGIPIEEIVAFCKQEYDRKWQKRFSEDLVEVLQMMGKTPELDAELVLKSNDELITKTQRMTEANRRACWKYNNGETDEEIVAPIALDVKKDRDKRPVTTPTKSLSPDAGLFAIKSAKITYEYTGMIKGTDVLYFDDFGKTIVLVQDRPEMSGGKKTIIWQGGKSTIINHDRKNVSVMSLRIKDTEPPTIATVSESQRSAEGYKKMPDETIAGKTCSVYEHKGMSVKYWLWNNIDLRLDNYALGKTGYVKKALSVQEIDAIPDSVLQIPETYRQ